MASNHQSSIIIVLLLLSLWNRISTALQCESYMYQPPVSTFSIKNGTSQSCSGFNGAKVFYNVTDSRSGEINFSIVTVNGTLCIGEYVFEVNTFNNTHTRQTFVICNADACNNNNGSLFTLNANELHFSVRYIFTGQYHAVLKSINGLKIWTSEVLNITTSYMQTKLQEIFERKDPLLHGSCDVIQNKNKLEITIIANNTLFIEPPGIKMFVVHNHSIYGFCYGNYSKKCSSRTQYQHFCEFFLNESLPEYRVFSKIDDPRCHVGTLWADIPTICVAETICNAKEEKSSPRQNSSTQKIVIGSVLLVAIIAAITFLTIKRLHISASRNRNSYNTQYSRQATNDDNEYLIIYARELEQFERIVDTLKLLLSCGNCSRVTTLYELDPNRCADPRKWLQNKLCDRSVSVILLLNIAAPYACDSDFVYRKSHCFDYLFSYAIQLLESYEDRSYHNLYKILTPETNADKFVSLNTLTTYNLPQHTGELLSDLKITGEESRSFEELLKNECNAYHDYITTNTQYQQSIFVKKVFL